MKKIFIEAEIHSLQKQLSNGEISFSRMVEILNEKASISQPDQGVTEDEINNVISRHDCHLEFYQQVYLVEELHSLFQSRNTVDLRSEHVKLITWVFDNWDSSMTDGNNEAVVDKYLSTRK